MLEKGHHALTSAELLAISLRTGRQGENAVDLARRLLERFGGLLGLYSAANQELLEIPGIGVAKVAQIRVIAGLSYRSFLEEAKKTPQLGDPEKVFKLIKCALQDPSREEFWGLMLDEHSKLIEIVALTNGTLGKVAIHPRELVKEAIRCGAAKVVLAHNHPSGDPTPSKEDQIVTKRLVSACRVLEIEVLDHVIVGSTNYFSFQQAGLVN